MIGDTWSLTASMRTLKYFLADAAKHKARVHQLDFIGAFLQANVKNIVFVKLDMRYAAYFPEYTQYFGRALKLLKYMYGMTNSGKLFLTLACKNAPIKSSRLTLDLCFAASARKYFKVIIDAVGDQVSPIISLFCKPPSNYNP